MTDHTMDRRALLAGGLAMLAMPGTALALPQGMIGSAWQGNLGARVRLIGAPLAGRQGHYMVGVEVRLDPGYKTYWRSPGDSGVPPHFDWSGSSNLAAHEVGYPAPDTFDDGGGGIAIGYLRSPVFPVQVRALDPDQPVRLVLKAQIGVCERFCVPVQVEARLVLQPQGPGLAGRDASVFWGQVPRKAKLGDAALPALTSAEPLREAVVLELMARWPKGESLLALVEAGSGWFFEPVRATSLLGQPQVLRVPVGQRPQARSPATDRAVVTLIAAGQASETMIALDGASLPQ